MRRGAGRGVVALAIGTLVALLAAGPVGAAERTSFLEPIDETFTDVGCDDAAPEVIHVQGWARVGITESDSLFLIQVTVSLAQSWTETETGESFSGQVSGPWSFRALPSGGETYSDVFTAIARGDQGSTALFMARLRATVTPDGQVRVDLVRLSGGCR